jgi:hypothetical protein
MHVPHGALHETLLLIHHVPMRAVPEALFSGHGPLRMIEALRVPIGLMLRPHIRTARPPLFCTLELAQQGIKFPFERAQPRVNTFTFFVLPGALPTPRAGLRIRRGRGKREDGNREGRT